MAAALAHALLPPHAPDIPPEWLRPDQRLSFGRALAAVRRYRGAVLADGVGTGKTYIGLAVAAALDPGRPIHVLAPAALLPQWRTASHRVGLEILTHSHETLSRGRPPSSHPGAVLLDESHRFRTGTTRRYTTLAPWCVGRQGLLLSATPVVNRLEDLGQQLRLLVRDNALAWAGMSSLRDLGAATPAGALAGLVVTGEDRTAALPGSRERVLTPQESAASPAGTLRDGLLALSLSPDRAIRQLIRGGLFAALASSPLAIADALGRYRSLLQHARDAAGSGGRALSRATIRRLVGSDESQLVLWPLVAERIDSPDLAEEDLGPVEALEATARTWAGYPDDKLLMLREVLSDGLPTLVFVGATATVLYLRRLLSPGVAWCTGKSSGLDTLSIPREEVFAWFRRAEAPGTGLVRKPRLLVTTDVAAEGLDLAAVQRVVHYDLPWTAVRLEQRGGRARRLGSTHRAVQIVRILPPAALEALLRQQAIIQGKAGLPGRLGLGSAPEALWRARARLAARWQAIPAVQGVARVPADRDAVVAGFRIRMAGGEAYTLVRARTGAGWTDDEFLIEGLLEAAHGVSRLAAPAPAELRRVCRALGTKVRTALRAVHGAHLAPGAPADGRTLRRLLALAREAAKTRDLGRVSLIARGLAALRRGHTAGEAVRVRNWPGLPLTGLLEDLAGLPAPAADREVERIELLGVLLLEREPSLD